MAIKSILAGTKTALTGRTQRELGQISPGGVIDVLRNKIDRPSTIPPLPILPAPQTRTTRGNYNRAQRTPRDLQVTLAAAEKPIRVLYGQQQVGAEIIYIGKGVGTGRWVFQFRWGWGPIFAIDSIRVGGNPLPGSAIVTHYLGTTAQLVDPTLAGMISGYTDTLVATIGGKQKGIAYSVVQIPWRDMPDSVEFTGELRGLMVADTSQGGGRFYSTNPALQYADFITDEIYGAGWSVNDASVQAQKDVCDQLLGGKKRAEGHMTIDNPANVSEYFAAFNSAALCFLVPDLEAGGVKLVPNRLSGIFETFDLRKVSIDGTINTQPINRKNQANCVRVHYTDTSIQPWAEAIAEDSTDGYKNGTEYPRISNINAFFIHAHEQAMRLAEETLRASTRPKFNVDWLHRDDGVRLERGDTIALNKIPYFPGTSEVRVMRRNLEQFGGGWFFRIYARDNDLQEYSNSTIPGSVPPGISVDDPTQPPTPSNLNVTEAPFLDAGGTYQTVLNATWDGVDHAMIRAYRVQFKNTASGAIINNFNVQHTGVGQLHSGSSSGIQPGIQYLTEVFSISNTGQSSAPASENTTPTGNALGPPPDVTGGAAAQRLWIDQMGATVVSLTIQWQGSADQWVRSYRIKVVAGGKTIFEQPVNHVGSGVNHQTEVETVQPNIQHTIEIWAVNVEGDVSTNANTVLFTPTGRTAVPLDVENLAVSEYPEYVELSWDNVLGPGDTAHRIVRGDQQSTWANANQFDRTEYMNPAARAEPIVTYRDYNVPAGPVRYFVKAIAFEGLESNNAISIDVTISEAKGSSALDRPRIPTSVELAPSLHMNFNSVARINSQRMCQAKYTVTNQDNWQTVLNVTGQRGFISRCIFGSIVSIWTSGTTKIGGRVTLDGRIIWETYNELDVPTPGSLTYVPIGSLWTGYNATSGQYYLVDLSDDYFPFNNQLKIEVYSFPNGSGTINMAVGYNYQIT